MNAHDENPVMAGGGLFRPANPWSRVAWGLAVDFVLISAILGFVVLGGQQQNGPRLGTWDSICRALGITSNTGPAGALQPPLQTPTRVAWTPATLAQIARGDAERGAPAAQGCVACHGERGVSQVALFPTLAGMDAAVIYKQLDDYRAGKRSGGPMNAIATALTAEASADVAAYFAARKNGLGPVKGDGVRGGHSLRQSDPATRLVFAGDPARGIAPCGVCHGPSARTPGAPPLQGQQPEYVQAQIAAFAQGTRKNDINQQMRIVAKELTVGEVQALAQFYAASASTPFVPSMAELTKYEASR